MNRITHSPWFYVTFILASAGVHGVMHANGAFGLEISDNLVQPFMEPAPGHIEKPFAAGPLIFYFYDLFFNLLQDPDAGFLAGALVLTATNTYVLLKLLSCLKAPFWLLLAAGLWTVISPSIQLLSIQHPEILLGLIFLLLLFISLIYKNFILMAVFLVHLILTHYILAGFSVIFLTGYLIKNRGEKTSVF
ncbi:MAG: hypothetical protein KGY60_08635 [Bacteroidales bacterium]|nr:hypothetical protein [Bacteroidales bacterium]